MRADAFPTLSGPAIVCLQAGNVNTGAFDPASELIPKAKAARAWVHVDGAFGLWAAAAPSRAHLMAGYAGADSWATDAHKYLNTPYDSGLAFVRSPMVAVLSQSVFQGRFIDAGCRRGRAESSASRQKRCRTSQHVLTVIISFLSKGEMLQLFSSSFWHAAVS
jgi:glutamate/tyrosine decarboxylase-like PLP-dependent enzyme